MSKLLIRLLLQGVAIFGASKLVPGIYLTDFWYALLVALILAVINVTVKPILQLLTLPITFFTLGLFLLVINGLMVMLVDHFTTHFSVDNIWHAMLFSIVISVFYWILDAIFGDKDK
ncbi:MAG TPA: phage holin family protein [Cytophagaceae bacterium]|jgi:putative membrane protein|nr:phage holin family protein [Cytophagaceae bacterium]